MARRDVEEEHDAFKQKLRAKFAKDEQRTQAKSQDLSLTDRLKARVAEARKGQPVKVEPVRQQKKVPEKQPQKAPAGRDER